MRFGFSAAQSGRPRSYAPATRPGCWACKRAAWLPGWTRTSFCWMNGWSSRRPAWREGSSTSAAEALVAELHAQPLREVGLGGGDPPQSHFGGGLGNQVLLSLEGEALPAAGNVDGEHGMGVLAREHEHAVEARGFEDGGHDQGPGIAIAPAPEGGGP